MLRAFRSARVLGKHWKLTVIAVLSLSIAMALGVISLSFTNTFVLLPPPAPSPERLVMVSSHSNSEKVGQISYLDYKYYQANNHVFLDLAAAPNSISVSEDTKFGKGAVKLISRPVTGNYLGVMGIRPHLGRLLTPDDEDSKTPVAVMTYTCWQRLGSDPSIVGKILAGSTIVGVMPKEFTGSMYGVNGDLLLPLSEANYDSPHRQQREARRLLLTGRLKPGVSRQQAQAEMSALAGQLASTYKEDKDRTAVVTRATMLPPDAIPGATLMAGVLMAVVLLVLLIACANVANLLLAIAVGRRQEAVIKLALGAPRGRLIREFLKESAILCLASGVLGYVIAASVIRRYAEISVYVPTIGSVSFGLNLHLDATVAAFAVGLMLIAIVATGLAPALYASSPSLSQVLSGELVIGGTGKAIRRNALVIVQVAVCTLVLVGMGLCERSLYNLRHVDPGFHARNLVAMAIYQSQEGYTDAQSKALFADLRRQVSALPGVESVTLASELPLLGVENEPVQPPGGLKEAPQVAHTVVDPAYFETLKIPLLQGRAFSDFDRENTPEVVIANRKMADLFWPGQDALGKTVVLGEKRRKATVVGVTGIGKYLDLNEDPQPFLYYALGQHNQGSINLIARTGGDPQLWIAPMLQIMRAAHLTVLDPVTLDNWMNLTLFAERMTAACAAGLSGLGLLLAVIGLFGAISYSVSERRKELGIRVALGARPGQLLAMVLRGTLLIAGAGIGIGLALGVGVTLLLRSQFYQVSAIEWTVLLPVAAAMLGVSALIAYVSARPWLGINPMEAVRHA
jgi:macrolide transport system ATP-binding/permease protein